MTCLRQSIIDFTTSTLTETTPLWSNTTAYVVADYVLVGTVIYKCVSAHTGKNPVDFINVYWVKWAISNKYAMLDLSSQTQSISMSSDIVVTFPQIGMETLTIGNYEASGIKIEVLAGDGTTILWQYDYIGFYNDGVYDYYSYMYEPYDFAQSRGVKIDIPVIGSTIRVTIYSSGIRAACGYLVGGYPMYMGRTLFGVGFKYNSFAVKTTDAFGTLTVTKRAVQDLVDFETIIDSSYLSRIRQDIKVVYNDILVFIVEDESSDYENLLTLGIIENSSVILSNSKITTISWSIAEAV